jgi:hypothetical protein
MLGPREGHDVVDSRGEREDLRVETRDLWELDFVHWVLVATKETPEVEVTIF